MHGPFRILGVALAVYLVLPLLRGHVYARSGLWGRDFERDADALSYRSAVLSCALLSAALLFVF
ncbi:MAG TPA: hypothetical protein VGI91_03735 [Steroidobacteraceae bacterium]|jgi:hypothetical protein